LINDQYEETAGKDMPIPSGRKYLILSVAGAMKDMDDVDFEMPPVQYFFEKK